MWGGGGRWETSWKPSHAPVGALLDATTIALLETHMQSAIWREHNADKLLSRIAYTSEIKLGEQSIGVDSRKLCSTTRYNPPVLENDTCYDTLFRYYSANTMHDQQ
jgi:hypothetical protein